MQSPKRLATKAYRGCMYDADMNIAQLGPWRPTKSLAGYDTPIPGLGHTAAGAHPFGALHGWSGRTTARTVDRHIRRHPSIIRAVATSHPAAAAGTLAGAASTVGPNDR